jgi:hypothetical protein|uniref:Opioid growth factor receptor (OGFr) conserved domain-containing protein n=1 Tax=Eutreptiella gymnastica TaxID=73025 RepID=A0A7S4FI99_9EUGL|mmetsp:Transcript_74959/g.126236  ORF Transcript_74959/g.126236 Transcript_74959/m.126236 type:complete len:217 (+) Transcript_74959:64-714(+)|eukprot:CAMPEP_0174295700 /NCGR_PEP_ID=MMETSP0809-20121228/45616_1 /TAXON_ID=73025 ORGANISM="Eutreptiella gymnastica-like, Strain CCMP1594" /NCGR_SAMPLE_ID=MMETSP0809 /ASSEMBLY_ACC=CAM_ASM_000658 /LENGTH=216 /DNA_ID=CAMNT_0015398189 /DNA_START=55 /DNA_END=705 /DNA_ORIENTATION=+
MIRPNADTQRYRAGYPGKRDDPDADRNYRFYCGQMKLPGYRYTIDDIHQKWFGDWATLEMQHDYIQWLFPIRELSMFNYDTQELMLHEAKRILENPQCKARLQKSYELLLDFYGMKLVDATTGQLARHDNFQQCYENLSYSGHNYLRITRIMKCLGELGFEHYKKPFIMHILKEIYENNELTPCKESCLNYWAGVLRNADDLKEVEEYARKKERSS